MPAKPMSASWVETITTTKAQEDWFDTGHPGLVLRVSKTGRKSWQLWYRPSGGKARKRIALGEFPAMRLKEARVAAALRRDEMDGKGEPAVVEPAPELLVKDLVKDYLAYAEQHKPKSAKNDEWALLKDVVPAWGDRPASSIRRAEVITLLSTILERGSLSQANHTLAYVRRMFNWALERELVEANPAHRVPKPAKPARRTRVLTDDELRKVWQASAGTHSGDVLRLQLLTAARVGEVMRMAWTELDLDAKVWVLPAERSKNLQEHRVPLVGEAHKILKDRQEKAAGPWVFPSRSQPTDPLIDHRYLVAKISRASGVEFRSHDLRRTVATNLGGLGVERFIIQQVLNHADPTVTGVYDLYRYDRQKRQALDRWEKRLRSVLSSNP